MPRELAWGWYPRSCRYSCPPSPSREACPEMRASTVKGIQRICVQNLLLKHWHSSKITNRSSVHLWLCLSLVACLRPHIGSVGAVKPQRGRRRPCCNRDCGKPGTGMATLHLDLVTATGESLSVWNGGEAVWMVQGASVAMCHCSSLSKQAQAGLGTWAVAGDRGL